MKVYTLERQDYEVCDILGIYATRDKAEKRRLEVIDTLDKPSLSNYQRQELKRSIIVEEYNVE